MFTDFLMKRMLRSHLMKLPEREREQMETLLERDPALLMTIAKEIQEEMKSGKDQMAAALAVMPKYQSRLKTLMDATQYHEW